MKTARTYYEKTVLAIGYAVLALFCSLLPLLLLSSARVIPILILGAIGCGYWQKWNSTEKLPLKKLWIAFWIVTLLVRVDLSFINLPGPPRITPYIWGLPTRATLEKARRGEVVTHGCVVNGLEPFWIVTW